MSAVIIINKILFSPKLFLFLTNNSRSMISASGSGEILQKKYTEDGSNIPARIFPYRNRQRPSIFCYRKENRTANIPPDNHRNLTVSVWNRSEIRTYPSVSKPSKTSPSIPSRIAQGFHQDFS